jgi:hypothetical protein
VPPRKNPPSSSRRAAGFQSINLSIYLSNKRGRGGREALAGGAGAGHVGGEVEGMMAGWDEREARRGEETARHQLGFGFVMFAALASSGRLRPRWMLRCGCTGAEGLDVLACT